jgi:saccharopine dehydrogenase-like NADP-dependent oxidoreductase
MTKTILILGAGKSAYNLISYLSDNSQKLEIEIKLISDKTPEYIKEIKNIKFLRIDISDKIQISNHINGAYIVVSLLPPFLHYKVALICTEYSVNMITASYLDDKIKSLNKKFKKNSCFLFMEMGLDPGIDHLSAKKVIDNLNNKGEIISFESYTGGLMKKDNKNPWGYKFTWNPMNVIKAGIDGSKYLKNGNQI